MKSDGSVDVTILSEYERDARAFVTPAVEMLRNLGEVVAADALLAGQVPDPVFLPLIFRALDTKFEIYQKMGDGVVHRDVVNPLGRSIVQAGTLQ